MIKLNTTQATPQVQSTEATAQCKPAARKALETPMGPTGQLAISSQIAALPSQALNALAQGAKNLGAVAAVAALTLGLAGCQLGEPMTEPRPYEPIEVHMSAGEQSATLGYKGETKLAADVRIKLHKQANAAHEGSRSGLFFKHAGEDNKLDATELQGMLKTAGIGKADFVRKIGANAAIGLRDATGDSKLSYGEFKPMIYAPSELAEGK